MRSWLLLLILSIAPSLEAHASSFDIYATETSSAGTGLLRIDSETGAQALVSAGEFGDFQVVGDKTYALAGDSVVEIDNGTGLATLVASGGYIDGATGFAVSGSGDFFLIRNDRPTTQTLPSVIRIDRNTSVQSVFSTGGFFLDRVSGHARDIEQGGNGNLIILDSGGGTTLGQVLEIDVNSSSQSVLFRGICDCYMNGATGLSVTPDGRILVSDGGSQTTAVVAFDPGTGLLDPHYGSNLIRFDTPVVNPDGSVSGGAEFANTDIAEDPLGVLWMIGLRGGYSGLVRNGRFESGNVPIAAGFFNQIQIVTQVVPEPGTGILLGLRIFGLAASRKPRTDPRNFRQLTGTQVAGEG